jgi:L-cysteate sulfo-lyase
LGRPHRYQVEDVHINADYLGEGYGVVTQGEREAITSFAQNEGLLLDPVYAGRAAAGLIGLIRRKVIRCDEQVLF